MHLWGIWPVCGLRKKLPGGRLTWIPKQWGIDWAEEGSILCRENSTLQQEEAWQLMEMHNVWKRWTSGQERACGAERGWLPTAQYTHTGCFDCPHFAVTVPKWGRDSSPHILVPRVFSGIWKLENDQDQGVKGPPGISSTVVLNVGTDCLSLSQLGSQPSNWFCRRGLFNKFLFYLSYYCWHYCVAKAKNPDKVGARSFQFSQVIYEVDL